MERYLLQSDQNRTFLPADFSQKQRDTIRKTSQALAHSLKRLIDVSHEESKSTDDNSIDIQWLMDTLRSVPSDLGHVHLVHAIWSVSKLKDDAQQQAALFDILGEEGMDSMIQIAEFLPKISKIPKSSLPKDENIANFNPSEEFIDIEEERRQFLVQEARNAAHVAAIAQAEADAATYGANVGRTTHTVTRKSDLQAQKTAKKAAKKAEQALKAAKDAGAIIDDKEWINLAKENYAFGSGGLLGRSAEELQLLQQALQPEGTRQVYDNRSLPNGTQREFGEGYEKVTIPAVQRDESTLHPKLAILDIMDEKCAKAFKGTTTLNPMQSTVFEGAFHTRDNLLICAPTGAGKTNVALLTIVAHFRDVGLIPGFESRGLETGRKVVYIAPMKALAQEVVEKFQSILKPSLQLITRELTGDMQLTRAEAESANILVTTPEKWDVVTRKSGNDENSLGNQCGLLIIDEVHLLADERGAVIESVVARLHRLVESRQRQIRIVGLSATLPNYQDVADFLRVPRRGLFFFGPEHRPVPLKQQFIGVQAQSNDRRQKDNRMNDICYEIVVDSLMRGYQVMVFVHSRKGTGDTASALVERASAAEDLERHFLTRGKDGYHGEAYNRYKDRASKSRNREVSLHFDNGIGIHHAGMLRGDRKLTEQMFSDGAIKVLCCTATLAWGINLPAHTVIVKGTDVYSPEKGGMTDLSILDVQQIFGRAGRPQFDSSGEATLITTEKALPRYLDKLVNAVPIESNFIKQLTDHLNAEIVGGTVTNVKEAVEWLKYTYLYIRMLRNPLAYGITLKQQEDDPGLNIRCRELIVNSSKELDRNMMIRYHEPSENFGVVKLGQIAAHFYVEAESISIFQEKMSDDTSLSDTSLSRLICCASEFENIRIRQEEFDEIDEIIAKACPLAVNQPVHDSADKAHVLLQAYIARHNIRSFTLISDTNYIASNAARVARAVFEMCLSKGDAGSAVKVLRIAKSIDRRVWWFQSPLRQFEGELKNQIFVTLEGKQLGGTNKAYDTFEYTLTLMDMQPGEVGQLCHWKQGGQKIQSLIRMLPNVELTYNVKPLTSSIFKIQITLFPIWTWSSRWHGGSESFWLLIEDSENSRIYHHEYITFSSRTHPEPRSFDVTAPAFNPPDKQYYIRLISDSWVGVEQLVPIPLEDITLPDAAVVHTDLIDLVPLPTSALQNPIYEQLYVKYETFNPIQTQLFHVLYHSDNPIFLGAPTGSGKTTIAELGILRMKKNHPDGICVYIAPLKSLARERLREWQNRLGSAPLNWSVLELSGDTRHDQKALNKADVLVCTPEKWDLISRGWKNVDAYGTNTNVTIGKAFVRRVRLLIIDEIHLLGEERGAVLEAIVSRTRLISSYMQTDNTAAEWTRIIGLSTAIANPHDLADWLGIKTKGNTIDVNRGLYNFRASVRPIPMKVHVQAFSGKHYCARMATMNKPCYAAIKVHSPNQPTLIFVASRRQTRLTALDIISYAAADEKSKIFLGCSEDYIESVAETIKDEALRHTITFGIGIHHAGLSSHDRDIVERLFLNSDIKVLVATATLAWGVNLPAHFVIVKGTEYFDSKSSRYVDYPLTDVLQMIGRAGRPGFDTKGVAVVMMTEDKKDYYKKFLYHPSPIESCLNEKMCENINAEISIGTVNSIVDAVGYLTWTFFSRRVKANPSYYGAKVKNDSDLESFFLEIVLDTLDKLKDHGCVTIEQGEGAARMVKPTVLGRCASNYYLLYRTPKQMEFGINEGRKLIQRAFEQSGSPSPEASKVLAPFKQIESLDEISVAWILYSIANTHEFNELPVRHNEDQLNAELSHDVRWGPDISSVLYPNHKSSSNISSDVMSDPHTKCFLLLQAYIERKPLPISDYINDTSTVMDQIPRLIAAMCYIAAQDNTGGWIFDLMCQFSKVRQIVSTRTSVTDHDLSFLPGFSPDVLERLRRNATSQNFQHPTVWSLRSISRLAATTQLKKLVSKGGKQVNIDSLVNSLFSLPLIVVNEANITHEVEKSSFKSIGKLHLNLSVEKAGQKNHKDDRFSLTGVSLVLGTPCSRRLLAFRSVSIHSHQETSKELELKFDWEAANADFSEDCKFVLLRIMFDEIRGLDGEIAIPLRVT